MKFFKHIPLRQIRAIWVLLVFAFITLVPQLVSAQMSWDDVNSIVKNRAYYQRQCGSGDPSAPTAGSATGKLFMIGDSITRGASTTLNTTLSHAGFSPVEIDGVDSRRLSEGSGDQDGLGVLQKALDAGKIKDVGVVVIALGTNGGVTEGNIQKALDIVKNQEKGSPNAKIFWVNVGADNSKRPPNNPLSADAWNQTLQSNASKGYTVIDWAVQVKQHPDYIVASDGLGVHLTQPGSQAFANTIAAALTGGGAPTTYEELNRYRSLSNTVAIAPKKNVFSRFKDRLVDFAMPTASAQQPSTTSTVPIPPNPPVIDNTGLVNAKIPSENLVDMNTIPNVQVTGSNLIRKEIAPKIAELASAFKSKFGRDLHIFSGYRDLAQQQQSLDAAKAKGHTNTVAPLGQSSHGWGLALDLEQAKLDTGNTGNDFNSEEYKWLASEGVKLGWKNPYYKAHGGQAAEEPWHWEYGTTNSWGAGTNGQNSKPQQKATENCSCGGGLTGASNLQGSENAEKIFNFFAGKFPGKPWIGAGFMGNMQSESGLNPRALEPGTTGDAPIRGKGYGLVQWTFEDRQKPLEEQAAAKSLPVSDLGLQLEYVIWELENKYKGILEELQAIPDGPDAVDKATILIEERYEVHAGGLQPKRVADAKAFFLKYASNAPSASSTSSGGTTSSCGSGGSSGLVVGGFSLPLDKKWYDQHKDWFTKPHHDYPAADIPVPEKTPVYSMTEGTVKAAPNGGGYGNGVTIDAGNGVTFIYGHGIDGGSIEGAKPGDKVKPGQLIMNSGNTGQSTGPHLHLELVISGKQHCPQTLFVGIVEGNIPDLSSLPTSGCSN